MIFGFKWQFNRHALKLSLMDSEFQKRRETRCLIVTKAFVMMGLHPRFLELNSEACLFLLVHTPVVIECHGQFKEDMTLQYSRHGPQGSGMRERGGG
jgi:hypothetical protein